MIDVIKLPNDLDIGERIKKQNARGVCDMPVLPQ